jgi:hypothetical protein
MGIARKKITNLEAKRMFLIDELKGKGILEINGKSIQDADYDELQCELVLSTFRQIDVECEENRFF